jgi:hypothetical protein
MGGELKQPSLRFTSKRPHRSSSVPSGTMAENLLHGVYGCRCFFSMDHAATMIAAPFVTRSGPASDHQRRAKRIHDRKGRYNGADLLADLPRTSHARNTKLFLNTINRTKIHREVVTHRLSQRNGFPQDLNSKFRTQHTLQRNIDAGANHALDFHQEAAEIQ